MNIVVLDGYRLNPGDLSWEGLEKLGAVTVHDRTKPDEIMDRARDAEAVLTNKVPLDAGTIGRLNTLKYIGVLATGYNIIDVEAAKSRSIPVTNVPAYGTHSVAQATIALLLELCHRVGQHSDATRVGGWTKNPDWCFWTSPQVELAGKTFGVVGFGRIGRKAAEIAGALGMRVVAHSRTKRDAEGVQFLELEDLLRQADVVSLHCPLFPETQGLIDARRLALMKPSAFLINTSRGPLIVEQDLADALNAGRLAGAAVDVLSAEPPPATNPLLSARNCLITPHLAWATREARTRLMDMAVGNLRNWIEGTPRNLVNPA